MRSPSRSVLFGALALAAGCAGGEATPPDGSYTVRGEVVRLPGPADGDLYVRHESIPAFRGRDGQSSGMMSMTMPFRPAPGLDLAEVAAGDRVELDFEVRWADDRQPLRVTRVAELPAGTRLEFDAAAEAAPEPDQAPPDSAPR
jgi:hypothetical protein